MVTTIIIWLVVGILIGALITFITRDEAADYQFNLIAGALGAVAGGMVAGSATGATSTYSVLGATITIVGATLAIVTLNGFRRGVAEK